MVLTIIMISNNDSAYKVLTEKEDTMQFPYLIPYEW